MVRKTIIALVGVLFLAPHYLAASSSEGAKTRRNSEIFKIVDLLSGKRGILKTPSSPHTLSKVAYVAVHSVIRSAAKKGEKSLMTKNALFAPVIHHYYSFPDYSFPADDLKKAHFKNLFVLMLATWVAKDLKENLFAVPQQVMANIQAENWHTSVPFLKGITKKEIGHILNQFSFALTYQSVVSFPKKLNTDDDPIGYSKGLKASRPESGGAAAPSQLGGEGMTRLPPRPFASAIEGFKPSTLKKRGQTGGTPAATIGAPDLLSSRLKGIRDATAYSSGEEDNGFTSDD
jgi:hypothetical protein